MFRYLIICAFVFGCSHGWTDEEVKLEFVKVLMKCNRDIKVEPQHLLSLQKKIMPKDPAAGCLLACAYKDTGMMDDKGMLSADGAVKVSEKYYADNPTKLENNKKFLDSCMKVNDETVSDGEKGCERSALMFKCLCENAPKYGIKA